MSALTDAMVAVAAEIKKAQVAIDPAHLAAIDAGITALQDHDSSQDDEIADTTAALQALHDGVVPPADVPPTT